MDNNNSRLALRLKRVERELRWWRCVIVVFAIFFIAGAASSRDEIVARKIIVTDPEGRPLVTLGSWGQGSGGLILLNATDLAKEQTEQFRGELGRLKELGQEWALALMGVPRGAEIYLSSRGERDGSGGLMKIKPTSLAFSTRDGGRGVHLYAHDPYDYVDQGRKHTRPGRVSLKLTDFSQVSPQHARGRGIELSVSEDDCELVFTESTTKATTTRAWLQVKSDGLSRFRLSDNKDAAIVAAVEPGRPALLFRGGQSEGRLDLHVSEGQPRIDLYTQGSQNVPPVSLLATPEGSSMLLFSDAQEKVRQAIGVRNNGEPFLR